MEKHGGRPLYTSEIAPLEHEMYFALEQPILDEILREQRQVDATEPFTAEYPRVSQLDGSWERVGVVITDMMPTKPTSVRGCYKITIFHYKDNEPSLHVLNEKDSRVYYLTETDRELICRTDVMYADAAYIDQHSMNAVEHTMLLDELLSVYQWQFADHDQRDILSK